MAVTFLRFASFSDLQNGDQAAGIGYNGGDAARMLGFEAHGHYTHKRSARQGQVPYSCISHSMGYQCFCSGPPWAAVGLSRAGKFISQQGL